MLLLIKLSFEEIVDEGMDCIHVAWDTDWWQANVNLWILWKAGDTVTIWMSIGVWRWTVLYWSNKAA